MKKRRAYTPSRESSRQVDGSGDAMRELVEDLWPELAHKLPPKAQARASWMDRTGGYVDAPGASGFR